VEGALALLHWFRRLRIRWETRDDIHVAFVAFVTFGCAIVCGPFPYPCRRSASASVMNSGKFGIWATGRLDRARILFALLIRT
jgi:hypothetical protein